MTTTPKQSIWDTMTSQQRVSAVNIDIMNHMDFSTLSGVVMMGNTNIVPDLPTAGTNGVDVFYGEEFVTTLSRKQLRFVQCHESLHKALRHCSDYKDIVKKYPQLSNIAMDYVVNALIEQTDPDHKFIEYTTNPKPLLDPKYFNRSFVDVLQDLLKNGMGEGGGGGKGAGGGEQGTGVGNGEPLDKHMDMPDDVDADELDKQIQDALNHGDMVQRRLKAGADKGGNPLSGLGVKRDTDWRNALREFIEQVVAGDEHSRFNPPNRRFFALDILMPTHFDVAVGELLIACDTSGSMGSVYPTVFGEIANICTQANPEKVRIVWWDTSVCGEQLFNRGEFDNIAGLLKPVGGGGTHPQCVADHIAKHEYKPTAVIWLTDGYLDACPTSVCANELWGVVNNDHFQPAHGKTLRIHA
jgi:predicted metal-dependent peptidase